MSDRLRKLENLVFQFLLLVSLFMVYKCQEQKAEHHFLSSTVEKFLNVTTFQGIPFIHAKDISSAKTNISVFISITSGPGHFHLRHSARNTWLLPCKVSHECDYRFFIDSLPSNMNDTLREEYEHFQDIVLRDKCELMNRHPSFVNYGNSPPIIVPGLEDNISTTELDYKLSHNIPLKNWEIGDYKYRRVYKIDWKTCFLKYVHTLHSMVPFHVFVEDDSFVCTENLLHQCRLLRPYFDQDSKISTTEHSMALPFRTGTFMFDGFDDSSTFMTREIADIFQQHYPSSGFNCSSIIDSTNLRHLQAMMWTSWGNSWMSKYCNWRHVIQQQFQVTMNVPDMNCFHANLIANGSLISKCMKMPLIYHSSTASETLLGGKDLMVPHICEAMLLIDKVKSPHDMFSLWNQAVGDRYLDFTSIFLHDGPLGWKSWLEDLQHQLEDVFVPKDRRRIDVDYENRRNMLKFFYHDIVHLG